MLKLKNRYRAGTNSAELDIDDAVFLLANGTYTVPIDENAPVHNYRALIKHCNKKGIDPSKLSAEEIKKFEIEKSPAQV